MARRRGDCAPHGQHSLLAQTPSRARARYPRTASRKPFTSCGTSCPTPSNSTIAAPGIGGGESTPVLEEEHLVVLPVDDQCRAVDVREPEGSVLRGGHCDVVPTRRVVAALQVLTPSRAPGHLVERTSRPDHGTKEGTVHAPRPPQATRRAPRARPRGSVRLARWGQRGARGRRRDEREIPNAVWRLDRD